MTTVRRYLLYDDEEGVANLLASQIARSLHQQEKIELVWFPYAAEFRTNKYRHDCHPAEANGKYAPRIRTITARGEEEWAPAKEVWWQSEFNGAILDIYDGGGQTLGNRFATWLARARFRGPVSVISKKDRPTSQFNGLSNRQIVHKTEENWEKRLSISSLAFHPKRRFRWCRFTDTNPCHI